MEEKILHSPNASVTNRSSWEASGGQQAEFDPLQASLFLWLPHVSIGLLLLLLVLLSFARFHCKHGHKYRKPAKGPRPAWQEVAMHAFQRQMSASTASQQLHAVTLEPDTGSLSVSDVVLTSLQLNVAHVDRSSFSNIRSLSARQSGTIPEQQQQQQKQQQLQQLQQQQQHAGSQLSSASSPSIVSTLQTNVATTTATSLANGRVTSQSEIDMTSQSENGVTPAPGVSTNLEPEASSGGREETAENTSGQKNLDLLSGHPPPRPSFMHSIGTDRVSDSSVKEGARVPARVWMTLERNRAFDSVIRSTSPLRAIAAVSLSNGGHDDEQKLLEKSPTK